MSDEDQYQKSLRLLQQWFDETPKEERDALFKKIDDMKIEGPTIKEYFDYLDKHFDIEKWKLKNKSIQ